MGLVTHSTEAWRAQMLSLLPPGLAWPRDDDAQLGRVMGGFAEEFARIEGRAAQLLDECHPISALEMLQDWERVLGLPDACVPVTGSIRERQMAAATRFAAEGGQSIAYYTALAATLGFQVEISEFHAFTADSDCTEMCCDDDWSFVWQVDVVEGDDLGDISDAWFNADSNADEYVRSFGSTQLECLIGRARPAHTLVLFSYPIDPEAVLWFEFV